MMKKSPLSSPLIDSVVPIIKNSKTRAKACFVVWLALHELNFPFYFWTSEKVKNFKKFTYSLELLVCGVYETLFILRSYYYDKDIAILLRPLNYICEIESNYADVLSDYTSSLFSLKREILLQVSY